ncbi:hypothetical protein DZJ_15390 [Dickeya ananatis]
MTISFFPLKTILVKLDEVTWRVLLNTKKRFNGMGIKTYPKHLATVEGKAAAKALELRYITTYERIFGHMPPYNPVYH